MKKVIATKQVENMEDPSSQPMRDGNASLESHASQKAVRIAQGGTTGKDSVADLQREGGNCANPASGTEQHRSDSQRMGGGQKLDMTLNGAQIERDQESGGNTDCQ